MDATNGGEVPKVLARNSACHQCRKRKLKCDAIRPLCINCRKSRTRTNDQPQPGNKSSSPTHDVDCTWDEPREPSARTKRRKMAMNRGSGEKDEEDEDGGEDGGGGEVGVKRARLSELEDRIAAFEKVLQDQGNTNPPGVSIPASLPQAVPNHGEGSANYWRPGDTTYPSMANISEITPPDNFDWTANQASQSGVAPMEAVPPLDFSGITEENVAGLYELIWPDWPKDLPSLEVVEHVAHVFFDKIPTFPKMIHQATFFRDLHLPPHHKEFPCRALLHGILGLTANHLSPSLVASRVYFPVGTPWTETIHPEFDLEPRSTMDRQIFTGIGHVSGKSAVSSGTPLGRFQMWHRRKVFDSMADYIDRGDRFVQCIQAQILVTALDHYNAWWTDCWMESGACIRMATPIRINESPRVVPDALERWTHILLPPSSNLNDQAVRDRTWWMAFIIERTCNMTTTWPNSISDDEITVELPVLQSTFDSGFGQLGGTQTFQSSDFFSSHPPEHEDGLVFFIKALRLFTDVNKFFRQYCRGSHSVSKYVHDPTLRLLLSQINAFRMGLPPHMRRPTQNMGNSINLDRDLVTAIMITHAAMATLGEPLITKETWTNDISRLSLTAIRAILSLLYDITATSFDLSLLPSIICYVWILSAKILGRFVEAARESGDPVSASIFRSEIQVFRLALAQYNERFPIGTRQLKIVDDMISFMDSGMAAPPNFLMNASSKNDDIFDEEFQPTVHAKSLGSTLSQTPESLSTPGQSARTPGQASASGSGSGGFTAGYSQTQGKSPAMMDIWNDPAGVGFDISSFSFDVGGVADLFAQVGQGMDQPVEVQQWRDDPHSWG